MDFNKPSSDAKKPRVTWQELAAKQGTKPIEDLDMFMEEYSDPSPDETADKMDRGHSRLASRRLV
jgi:hypothetical protein